MTNVEILTVKEARQRRAELLKTVPFSEEELRARAVAYQLTAAEVGVLDRINTLDFLLGK